MKPHLKMNRGMWLCGVIGQPPLFWAVARTPKAAFDLWKRCQP